jgi:hypothetical protein
VSLRPINRGGVLGVVVQVGVAPFAPRPLWLIVPALAALLSLRGIDRLP